MKIHLLLLLAWSIISVSCSNLLNPPAEASPLHDFSEVIVLQGEGIATDSAFFRWPYRVHVQGTRAVVGDLHGTDHFLHLFTYPEFRYLSSFGKRGEGPEELLRFENMRWENDSILWVLDSNKRLFVRYVLAASGSIMQWKDCLPLEEEVLSPFDFVRLDGNRFLIPDYSGKSRFYVVGRHGEYRSRFGTIPIKEQSLLGTSAPAVAQAWRSFIDFHPGNHTLATVTQLGDVTEVYRLFADTLHAVYIGQGGEPRFQVSGGYAIPTGGIYHRDVQVGDSAIYVSYGGQLFKETERSLQQGIHLPNGCKYIRVFSLTGKPLRCYELDRYVTGIFVDESKKTIWALDMNGEEPIVKFSL